MFRSFVVGFGWKKCKISALKFIYCQYWFYRIEWKRSDRAIVPYSITIYTKSHAPNWITENSKKLVHARTLNIEKRFNYLSAKCPAGIFNSTHWIWDIMKLWATVSKYVMQKCWPDVKCARLENPVSSAKPTRRRRSRRSHSRSMRMAMYSNCIGILFCQCAVRFEWQWRHYLKLFKVIQKPPVWEMHIRRNHNTFKMKRDENAATHFPIPPFRYSTILKTNRSSVYKVAFYLFWI